MIAGTAVEEGFAGMAVEAAMFTPAVDVTLAVGIVGVVTIFDGVVVAGKKKCK